MKKSRIISLLLTLSLALTSLPMMTVSAAEDDAAENTDIQTLALTDGTFSVGSDELNVSVDSTDSTNKYLQVYDRLNNGDGVSITMTFNEPGTYVLEFDMRQSVDVTSNEYLDFDFNVKYNGSVPADDAVRVVAGDGVKILSAEAYVASAEEYKYARIKDTQAYFDYNSDGSWRKIRVKFTVDDQNSRVLKIVAGGQVCYSNPMDIDNLVIKDSSETVVWQENFESTRWNVGNIDSFPSSTAAKLKGEQIGRVSVKPNRSIGASYAIVVQGTITSMTVADDDTITYSDEIILAPGEYTIKGSIRNGYFENTYYNGCTSADDCSRAYLVYNRSSNQNIDGIIYKKNQIVFNNNSFNLTLSSDITAEVKTYTGITTGWTDFELAFTVTEEMTMPTISFAVDHAMPYTIDGTANQVPVDIKDMRLEYILAP